MEDRTITKCREPRCCQSDHSDRAPRESARHLSVHPFVNEIAAPEPQANVGSHEQVDLVRREYESEDAQVCKGLDRIEGKQDPEVLVGDQPFYDVSDHLWDIAGASWPQRGPGNSRARFGMALSGHLICTSRNDATAIPDLCVRAHAILRGICAMAIG